MPSPTTITALPESLSMLIVGNAAAHGQCALKGIG